VGWGAQSLRHPCKFKIAVRQFRIFVQAHAQSLKHPQHFEMTVQVFRSFVRVHVHTSGALFEFCFQDNDSTRLGQVQVAQSPNFELLASAQVWYCRHLGGKIRTMPLTLGRALAQKSETLARPLQNFEDASDFGHGLVQNFETVARRFRNCTDASGFGHPSPPNNAPLAPRCVKSCGEGPPPLTTPALADLQEGCIYVASLKAA
jgi:hypothetical protein